MSTNIKFVKKIIEGQICLLSHPNLENIISSSLVFILIPGNPSIPELYIEFASLFTKKFNYPLIISSLASNTSKNFSLEKAISLKKNFFEYLLNKNPNTKYIVLGHSIGNYILIKSLQKLNNINTNNIIGIYCLFPAMKNLYQSFTLQYKIISYNIIIINIIAFLSNLFQILPLCLIILFFKLISNVPKQYVERLARNATQNITKQMLLLTRDEGKYVKEYEKDFINFMKNNAYRLRMIYGKFDVYGNEETAKQFKELVPEVTLKIVNILHAFVLGYSQNVFNEIEDYIKKDIKDFKKNDINENNH